MRLISFIPVLVLATQTHAAPVLSRDSSVKSIHVNQMHGKIYAHHLVKRSPQDGGQALAEIEGEDDLTLKELIGKLNQFARLRNDFEAKKDDESLSETLRDEANKKYEQFKTWAQQLGEQIKARKAQRSLSVETVAQDLHNIDGEIIKIRMELEKEGLSESERKRLEALVEDLQTKSAALDMRSQLSSTTDVESEAGQIRNNLARQRQKLIAKYNKDKKALDALATSIKRLSLQIGVTEDFLSNDQESDSTE